MERADLCAEAAARTERLLDCNLAVLYNNARTSELLDAALALGTFLRVNHRGLLRLDENRTRRLEDDRLDARFGRDALHGLDCFLQMQRIDGFDGFDTNAL